MKAGLEELLDNTIVYNLQTYMNYLFQEDKHTDLAWRIKSMVDSVSITGDIETANHCCDLYLEFSNIHCLNKPMEIGKPPITAFSIMVHAIILYARSVDSSSDYRGTFNIRDKLSSKNKLTHDEVCTLRNTALAHYGPGKLPEGEHSFAESIPLLVTDPESFYIKVSSRAGNIGLMFMFRFKMLLDESFKISRTRSKKNIDRTTKELKQHLISENITSTEMEEFRFDYVKHEGSRERAALRLANKHVELHRIDESDIAEMT